MSAEADLRAVACLAGLVEATVTDGITTLFSAREGPVTGGLVFRVGRGDETLATAGITHLVEHLALYRQNLSDVHHNGQTASAYTLFHATGTAAEVVAFLNGVCAALRDLPLARLTVEKEILRTEAAQRNDSHAFDQIRMWRHGAQGQGLLAYEEEGLPRLTADDVTEWVRTRFTRDNAVVFFTSTTVPEGLDLALPAGHRFAVVVPDSTLPSTPAWFRGAAGGVLVDALVPRTSASILFARVASRVLFRELRQEGGLSYTASCDYEPVDGQRARVAIFADALPEKQDAVVGATVDALAAMRAGRVDQADLDAARKQLQVETSAPDRGAAMLPAVALNLLMGTPVQHPDSLTAERDAVTVDDVTEVARTVWDGALAQVPRAGLDWAGFAAAPVGSEAEVNGSAYPHLTADGVALVVGTDGVSLRTPQGVATVRYADCVLASAYPDGGRRLTGRDGFRIVIEPTLYRWLTPVVVADDVDRHISPDVVQHLPARPADQIPRPEQATAGSPPLRPAVPRRPPRVFPRWRGFGTWATVVGVALAPIALVAVIASIADTSDLLGSPVQSTTAGEVVDDWLWALGLTCVAVAALWGGVRRRRMSP